MAILGRLIKTAIDLGSSIRERDRSPLELQQDSLRSLLEEAATTAFGLYYHFERMLESDDLQIAFSETVPLHDYDALYERWWHRQEEAPDITWPGYPPYFARTSGTTGVNKYIPVTESMLRSIRRVGIDQAVALSKFELPPAFFEKDILMLGSSARLNAFGQGALEGEISGINAQNMPAWFNTYYKPGKEIAEIDSWDERLQAIVQAAPQWDVSALAGIPSWIQAMLKAIQAHYRLDTIHDIWPSLRVYVSGGVAFEPFRSSLNKLMAEPLLYLDTYLASEGFFAYTARPETLDMRLALEHGIYYEFIPFDERGFDGQGNLLDEPEVLHIAQVEEGQEYALVVSTCAGAWRYLIGDTVTFTDLRRSELVISGRTKYFLNVAGSQLSEEKINRGIRHLADETGLAINEYAVAALKDEENDSFYHQWVLGVDALNGHDPEQLARQLDHYLKELNQNYEVARTKALSGVHLQLQPADRLYDWLERKKKKGGQIKLPKVMKEEDMRDLLAFLGS